MKRTTVVLPDDLANLLELERRRRNQSAAEIVREALASYLKGERGEPGERRKLGIASLGRSGSHDTARQAEEILAREWGGAGGR